MLNIEGHDCVSNVASMIYPALLGGVFLRRPAAVREATAGCGAGSISLTARTLTAAAGVQPRG